MPAQSFAVLGPAAARYLRYPEVSKRLGVKVCTLRFWVRKGVFPPPHKLGERAVAFHVADIEVWERARRPAVAHACTR